MTHMVDWRQRRYDRHVRLEALPTPANARRRRRYDPIYPLTQDAVNRLLTGWFNDIEPWQRAAPPIEDVLMVLAIALDGWTADGPGDVPDRP